MTREKVLAEPDKGGVAEATERKRVAEKRRQLNKRMRRQELKFADEVFRDAERRRDVIRQIKREIPLTLLRLERSKFRGGTLMDIYLGYQSRRHWYGGSYQTFDTKTRLVWHLYRSKGNDRRVVGLSSEGVLVITKPELDSPWYQKFHDRNGRPLTHAYFMHEVSVDEFAEAAVRHDLNSSSSG